MLLSKAIIILYLPRENMAYHHVHMSTFDRITKFVLSRVEKHRGITVLKLKRILRSGFGSDFFRKRRNINLLMDTMEYLLYTKRLAIVNPNQQRGLKTEMPVVCDCKYTVNYTKFSVLTAGAQNNVTVCEFKVYFLN